MNGKKLIFSLTLTILLLLSACNLSGDTTEDGGGTTGDPVSDEQTRIYLAVQQTQTALGPLEPTLTFTPSLTPSITYTLTPDKPMVTVSMETNCRTGPSTVYEVVGVLLPGTPAEVVGKYGDGDSWIIKLPSNPAITCWLWGFYATVVGNTSGLTAYTPPPTPTPEAGFTISYLNMVNCMGWVGFRFQLTNTGPTTWESYRVTVTDSTTSITNSWSADDFRDSSPTCMLTTVLLDLTPGEVGVTGNWETGLFNYSPVGHTMSATFKLCTQNGLLGTCVDKSISFTP